MGDGWGGGIIKTMPLRFTLERGDPIWAEGRCLLLEEAR